MPPMQGAGFYFESWSYLNPRAALKAMEEWDSEKDKEPGGWHRHVMTGRYRINGDKALEYVKNPLGETLEVQVAYALSVTHGETRVVKNFKQTRTGNVFPFGTTHFVVMSESPQCPHNPRCQTIDHVYQRFDRWVVLSMEQFYEATIDNILRRLTSDNGEAWQDRNLGYLAELYGMTVVRLS
jgi:hypothetical protein